MRVSSDLPFSVRDVPSLRCPSQAPEVQHFDRQPTADQEFPLNVPVAYDWFLLSGSRRGFRQTVTPVCVAVSLFLVAFLLLRRYNFLTFPVALVFVLGILVIVAVTLWTVAFPGSRQ